MAAVFSIGAFSLPVAGSALAGNPSVSHTTNAPASGASSTLWVQKYDSCATPLGGAVLELTDSSGNAMSAPQQTASGASYPFAHPDGCPSTAGSCVRQSTGCASFAVPVPSSGTATYQVIELQPPPHWDACWFGDRQCVKNVLTVVIASDGTMQVTDAAYFANGHADIVPTVAHPDIDTGNPYWTGTQADPGHIYDGRLCGKNKSGSIKKCKK